MTSPPWFPGVTEIKGCTPHAVSNVNFKANLAGKYTGETMKDDCGFLLTMIVLYLFTLEDQALLLMEWTIRKLNAIAQPDRIESDTSFVFAEFFR